MAVDFTTKTAPKPKAAPKPKTPASPSPDLARRAAAVENLFEFAQMGSVFKGWYADAATYAVHGPPVAQGAAQLAETNTWVAKGLDVVDLLGPAFGLAEVFLPLGLQLAVNHGRLPAEPLAKLGIVPPETLEAQAKASIARQQINAIKAQRKAEAELAEMKREAESMPEFQEALMDSVELVRT